MSSAMGAKTFVITDAGMNDLIRPALYQAYHEILPVIRDPRAKPAVVDIVGPVCETGDFFARDREMPEVKEGDLVAILDAGAYGMSLSSNYNSRPRPAEVLVEGKRARLIRRQGNDPRPDRTGNPAALAWYGGCETDKETAGPSTTLRSGRNDNLLGTPVRSSSHRIVIPTGAERSGGTGCFFRRDLRFSVPLVEMFSTERSSPKAEGPGSCPGLLHHLQRNIYCERE